VAFALLILASLRAHELWRDEAQAWLLARDAGFWPLLTGAARVYEGHPFVWFWLLRAVSLLSTSYVALQAVAYVLTLANVSLVLALSPLRRYERVLLASSYFVLFEFGIIARSYGLGVLWLLVGLHLLKSDKRFRLIWTALCCGLAVNTVLLALPAAALLLGLGCSSSLLRAVGLVRNPAGEDDKLAWAAVAIFVSLTGLALGTTPVSSDAVVQLVPISQLGPSVLLEAGARLWDAFAPLPPIEVPPDWWNVNVLLPRGPEGRLLAGGTLPALGGFLWLGAWIWILARRSRGWLTGGALFLAVSAVVLVIVRLPNVAARYDGHIVLCVVVAMVHACRERPELGSEPAFRVLFAATFGAQAVAACIALAHDLREPFSHSRATASYLQEIDAHRSTLIGFEYHRLSPVAAYLDQQLYSPERRRHISYGVWSRDVHRADYSTASRQVILRAFCYAQGQARQDRPALMVTSRELRLGDRQPAVELLRAFGHGTDETYFVYRVNDLPGRWPELRALCERMTF
jgi:hypothetical protein